MATALWTGNAKAQKQKVTLTVGAVATDGTLTATINGKSVTYTILSTDTTTTLGATGWLAALQSSDAPPEFGEINWTRSTNVITGEAAVAGVRFQGIDNGLTVAGAGGGTVTLAQTVANISPSDVNTAANWLRDGNVNLPVANDDIVLRNSSVPLLYSLDAFKNTRFKSFTRFQSHTGNVGLPENNPLGYVEYRPTYFQFLGPADGALPVTLGIADGGGGGPSRERYDVQGQRTDLIVLSAGGATDAYAIRFLGTHASNTLKITGTSVGIAMLARETATIASGTVDGGGSLALGSGVTFSGTLTLNQGTLTTYAAPNKIDAGNSSAITVVADALTFATLLAAGGTNVLWLSNSNITRLRLATSSTFDKSRDIRSMTITGSELDGDSCQVIDPNATITYTNPTTVHGVVSSGPFTFLGDRDVHVNPSPTALNLAEQYDIASGWLPIDLAARSVSLGTPWINLRDYDHGGVIIVKDVANTSVSAQDPVVTLDQATDANGMNAKGLSFTTIFRKQGALVRDVASFTKITQGAKNTYDGAAANSQILYIIEFDRTALDTTNGFVFFRALINDPGGAEQWSACLTFRSQPRRAA